MLLRQTAKHDQDQAGETVEMFDLGMFPFPIPAIEVLVEVDDTPSGTTPVLDYTPAWSTNKDKWLDDTVIPTISAAGAFSHGLVPQGRYLRLTPVVGGTPDTPTLSLVETVAGVAAVGSAGELTLPTIPVGAVKAAGELTLAVNPTNGDTITVGGTVYTFVTIDARGPAVGNSNVVIGATLAITKVNLVAAINLSGAFGTEYSSGTIVNASAVAAAFIGDLCIITALIAGTAGNSIVTVETFTSGSNLFDAATLGTEVTGVAGNTMNIGARTYTFVAIGAFEVGADNEISIGANVAATQANILAAMDLSGTAGIDYSTGMTANAEVTWAAWATNASVITAVVKGVVGDAIVTTETFTPVGNVFDAVTLGTEVAGVDAVAEVTTLHLDDADNGDFDFTVDAQTSAGIVVGTTAAALKALIEALSTVTAPITVTGDGKNAATAFVITFNIVDELIAVSSGADTLTQTKLFTGVTVSINS